MTNIILTGACGRMGKVIGALCAGNDEYRIVAGVDINAASGSLGFPYPVYEKLDDFEGEADVIIDFSHHSAIHAIAEYATKNNVALVAATTGYNEEELAVLKGISEKVPVFYSRNMSLGINLIELTKKATAVLGKKFDIEIVERHHNKKLDAPSGTALMLADAAAETMGTDPEYVYDRQSVRRARSDNEIGIHSVRGGSIVGDHEVAFCGQDEVISLSHSAYSRDVFAEGALSAAAFVSGKPAGMYDMSGLISSVL